MDENKRNRRPNNPRSFEDVNTFSARTLQRPWRYHEKIPIDPSWFPPHVRPASVIIGAKGSNHNRMQKEGNCCVQVRGRDISSPGSAGADDDLHLWVKYDHPDQLRAVKNVLEEIIRQCDGTHRQQGSNLSLSGPRFVAPAPTHAPKDHVELLWCLHLLAHYHKPVLADSMSSVFPELFGFEFEVDKFFHSVEEVSTREVLSNFPHVITIQSQRPGDPPVLRPVLPPETTFSEFQQIDASAWDRGAADGDPSDAVPEPLLLLVQGLHAMISAHGVMLVDQVEREFEAEFGEVMHLKYLNIFDLTSFLRHTPSIFTIGGRNATWVEAVPNVNFQSDVIRGQLQMAVSYDPLCHRLDRGGVAKLERAIVLMQDILTKAGTKFNPVIGTPMSLSDHTLNFIEGMVRETS